MRPLQIFKAGTHTASSGQTLTFTAADLAATAAAYDATAFAAPLVVGHPALDEPAYGWVKTLAHVEGALEATPEQLDPQFADLVKAGRYRKISAAFFMPNAPNNPVPGVYSLRHVGFLGAVAPALKGLRPPAFANTDEGVIELEFSESPPAPHASPSHPVDPDMPNPAVVDDPLAAEKAALAQREAAIAAREAALNAEKAGAARAADAAFADALIREGRVLPRDRAGLVAVFAALNGLAPLEFAEGGEVVKRTPRAALDQFLKTLPVQVDFSERSAAEPTSADTTAAFTAPHGYAVDPTNLSLHTRALAYQVAHNTDYVTALAAVGR
ncbi:MAG TPA: peptidase [Candidatus Contendobacter sp.]|nr:peptidase [Candidatus Contendobacter sp.]